MERSYAPIAVSVCLGEWTVPGSRRAAISNPFGARTWMSRILTILFRRDPSRDRHKDSVHLEGYMPHWPDGQPVAVGLDAFCKHGQRLLGLGKHLAGCREKLLKLVCFPLGGREDDLNRIPG